MNKKILITCVCVVCLLIGVGFLYPRHTPKISVVMSTYNQAKTLPEAIDSIIGQSFDDWELIIVNDGSTDNTADILHTYASKDNRIRILTNAEHKGFASSFNRGIDKARGEFIARMDDDDLVTPNRLAKQYAFMQEHPDTIITYSFIGSTKNKKISTALIKVESDDTKINLYLGINPIYRSSLFMRRDFLNQHHIRYNDAYEATEDLKFYLDLYDAGAIFDRTPYILALYRPSYAKSQQHYDALSKNKDLFFQQEILPRFGVLGQVSNKPSCDQFWQMVEANTTKAILPQLELVRNIEKKCPRNIVVHKEWKDSLVFDGSRVCRLNAQRECGSVQFQSQDELMIKWDRGNVDTFIKKDAAWRPQEPDSTVKKKETKSGQALKAKPTQPIASVKKKLSSDKK